MAGLPRAREVLVVCAHPDDESFGLGALVDAFVRQSTKVDVLCFTHGEASTLGSCEDLGKVRARELRAAADVLGVEDVLLLSYADGHLADIAIDELSAHVQSSLGAADLVLVFDEGGITGHADHERATETALHAAATAGVGVLAWALPEGVASQLNEEFGTGFVGRGPASIDIAVEVDRKAQSAAIACHASQANDNPVLRRRLELLGSTEHLRWLRRSSGMLAL